MTINKTKTEKVTFAVDMILEYQSDEGREYLIKSVLRDIRMDMAGCGSDKTGRYSVRYEDGSARIVS